MSEDVVEKVDVIQQSAAASLKWSCTKIYRSISVYQSKMYCGGFEQAVANDICQLYYAALEMAKADFFHCETF